MPLLSSGSHENTSFASGYGVLGLVVTHLTLTLKVLGSNLDLNCGLGGFS
jgi:hypothetical protein